MSDDEQLAALLDRVTRQQNEGHQPDFEALAREHPNLISELRQLLHIAELARQCEPGHSSSMVTEPRVSATAAQAPPDIFDGYEMMEEIGRGAMGVVYKARDPQLQRFVALKVLLGGEHASAAELARFRSEAQAAAGLSHRNIVPVYQVGESDGRAYFCMKYVEGTTLAAKVREGPLPFREAARVVALIARAVDHAHANGILHRDLKPSNVLIDEEGQPVVTDFGLAKRTQQKPGVSAMGDLTATGVIVGTPSYMAPEQAAAVPGTMGPASDIYSIGAVLYELLTG